MPELDRPATKETESPEPRLDYFAPSVFGSAGNIACREAEQPSKLSKGAMYVYGGLVSMAGLVAVGIEQSPWNENYRIHEGLEALVRTGSPVAVEYAVRLATVKVEAIPAAVIILAVHSNNPVIGNTREKLGKWQEDGEERVEYRKAIKLEEQEVKREAKNEKRVAEGKEPKLSKLEKKAIKLEEQEVKREAKNEKRVAEGKEPKEYKDITDNRVGKFVKRELTDLGLALGLGAGIVVFKNALTNRNVKLRESIMSAVKATIEISLVSGKIGYFVAAGTRAAKFKIPGTEHIVHYEQQAQWLIDYGTDTKALMGILLLLYTPSTLKKLWHRMPKREARFQKWRAQNEESGSGELSPTCTIV